MNERNAAWEKGILDPNPGETYKTALINRGQLGQLGKEATKHNYFS